MDCSCAPMFRFYSVASDGATTERPNLEPRFLVNFVPFSGRMASPITHRFGLSFRCLLEDQMSLATEIFKNAKKSATELCQILRMVTVEIVIKSTRVMGVRVTISCRYALSLMGRCFVSCCLSD